MIFLLTLKKIIPHTKVILLVLLIAFAAIQTILMLHYRDTSRRYSEKIAEIERGVLLTDQLDTANAELNQEQDDFVEDLRSAEGFNSPLPPAIRSTVGRVQRSSGTGGTSE